jgi:hypothetical protein
MRFFSGVSNFKETPYIVSDTFANKVNYSAAIKGAVYIARDGASVSEPSIYQANGTTWVPIGGYGIGTDATLQNVTDNGATSTDILKLTGADGIYVDVPNKQFSLGAGNFVNSDTQGFQMVDNTYKIGDIFNLHTRTKLAIDDDDLFIQANSDTFSVLNNANTLNIAKFALAEILLTDNSGATANTLRMYLGNVGIFTTNPTYKFDVHAVGNNANQGIGIRNTNGGSSATASLFLGNNTGDNQAKIFLNSTTNTANGGANSLNIGTVANSNFGFITNNVLKMLLDSTGKLGLGNNTPLYKLSVSNAANGIIAQFTNTVDADLLIDLTTGVSLLSSSSAVLAFGTVLTERMRLNTTGNLLIATNADNLSGAKLQIQGDVSTSGSMGVGASAFPRKLTVQGADDGNLQIRMQGTASTTSYCEIGRESNSTGEFRINVCRTGTVLIAVKIADTTAAVTLYNLIGTGSRAVLADANGVLSAPVSDISVKENIEPLNYGIAEIMALNPVSFEFIEGFKNYGEGKQIGNIAQDVYNVIPEAVFTTPSTGKMGINYDQFNGVYIKALQQLQEQIFELKAELNFLKNK